MSDVSVDIKITNLPQLKAAFESSPRVVGKYLDRAIKKAIIRVGRASRIKTPVDTGRLRASTRETFRPLYGDVGTYTNYDIFVHEGTRYMKGRPFMRLAVEQEQQNVENDFKVELDNALSDIGNNT